MRRETRFVSIVLLAVLVAVSRPRRTKISGTAACNSDPPSPVAVTDKPNHSVAVAKAQCTSTTFVMAGLQSKDGTSIDLEGTSGDTISVRSHHVATMTNGDTTVAKHLGSGKLKDGKLVNGEGTGS